jgi:hypothetical protein
VQTCSSLILVVRDRSSLHQLFLKYNNFCGVMAFVAAFHSAAVSRLKRTWEKVSSSQRKVRVPLARTRTRTRTRTHDCEFECLIMMSPIAGGGQVDGDILAHASVQKLPHGHTQRQASWLPLHVRIPSSLFSLAWSTLPAGRSDD